jgi:hypothetical protein
MEAHARHVALIAVCRLQARLKAMGPLVTRWRLVRHSDANGLDEAQKSVQS